MSGSRNVQSDKCQFGEIAAGGNVECRIGEELVGELSSRGCVGRGSVGRGNVQLGNCPRIMAKHIETYMHCHRAPKNTRTDTEFTIVEHGRKKLKKGYLYILQKKLTNDCTS